MRVLISGANAYISVYRKNFLKFWWNEELDMLKQASIDSNKIWKAAGKPRQGPVFDKRQLCRKQYRKRIKECNNLSTESYSNELHEALLRKDNTTFWKCWRSKFAAVNKCVQAEGCVDAGIIVEKFRNHFSKSYTFNNACQADVLKKSISTCVQDIADFLLLILSSLILRWLAMLLVC